MRKQTFTLYSLSVLIIFFASTVYGNDEVNSADAEPARVVISYERALSLTLRDLLPLLDADTQIRGLKNQIDELANDINELQTELWNDFFILNMQLHTTRAAQERFAQNTEEALLNIMMGFMFITDEDTPLFLTESLYQAMSNMIMMQEASNAVAVLEAQHRMVLSHLEDLNSIDIRKSTTSLEHHIEILKLYQTQVKIERESILRNTIIAALEMERLIEISYKEIKLLEENLRRVTARYEFGFAGFHEIRTAEHLLTQARAGYSSLLINQINMRLGLNHLINQPLNQNTTIIFTKNPIEFLSYTPAQIDRIIANTPTMRRLQLEVNHTRKTKEDYKGDDHNFQRDLREAYERAVMERNQRRTALEVAWQRGYNNITNLINQRVLWVLELENVHFALDTALAHLSLGRTTAYEADLIRFDILTIEQSIAAIDDQIWVLSFLLQNPFLL
ncbi:MAG: hypothetical protein FWE90_11630 [Defluviitaleaceae bacterium]|nr:hypothetical protein [Defluviitaleaceae bacterium]